eukprot:CAMPEP_0171085950 /NCGR_PEP_ID=MMETSP0766_2-20121228/19248_1 /TAXON_ID=439317 /ORGANISM="Gambierdiscus australes, Strain CAWD 149" /LENGTH=135 /DNA_ID=CAMNT_0011543555 /DNA_START=165 /DNA_END=571 /DNA_ORIENTATION=-
MTNPKLDSKANRSAGKEEDDGRGKAMGQRTNNRWSVTDGGRPATAVALNPVPRLSPSSSAGLGRWAVQKGFQHIPKSEKKERMIENVALFDWSLSDEDMEKLDGLTPPQNFETFAATYRKCVVRDTPLASTHEGV